MFLTLPLNGSVPYRWLRMAGLSDMVVTSLRPTLHPSISDIIKGFCCSGPPRSSADLYRICHLYLS